MAAAAISDSARFDHPPRIFFGGLLDALLLGGKIGFGRSAYFGHLGIEFAQTSLDLLQAGIGLGACPARLFNALLNRRCPGAKSLRQAGARRPVDEAGNNRKIDEDKNPIAGFGADPNQMGNPDHGLRALELIVLFAAGLL